MCCCVYLHTTVYQLHSWRTPFVPCLRLSAIIHSSVCQYDVSDYAFGMGLIDAGQRRALKRKEEDCLASIKGGNYK